MDSVANQYYPYKHADAADDVVGGPREYPLPRRRDVQICEYNVKDSKKYEESPDADARASNITLFNYSTPRS